MVPSLQEQIWTFGGAEQATKDCFFVVSPSGVASLVQKQSLIGYLFACVHWITKHLHFCFGIYDRLNQHAVIPMLQDLSENSENDAVKNYALRTIAHIRKQRFSPPLKQTKPIRTQSYMFPMSPDPGLLAVQHLTPLVLTDPRLQPAVGKAFVSPTLILLRKLARDTQSRV